ncbi:MAG: peptidoglycan DD-metalloendopeptidase family protein [Leptospirales bacterium]|nr:peptidoglycan DD-metalloendopeptidase family protein [Leptospirales bacterium]
MTMPTIQQIKQYKYYAIAALISAIIAYLSINTISYFFTKKVYVNKSSYLIKNGFPIFTSEKDYIDFIKSYPYNLGVQLTIYKISPGETLWTLRKKFNINIETIIAANPHLKSFDLSEIDTLVIPARNGTLFTFDDYRDVGRMYKMMGKKNKILGDYKLHFFRIISPDDMRMVFFENEIPLVVNNDIQKIYAYKTVFLEPLDSSGYYTSMFGDRFSPYDQNMTEFHNGVDIATRNGTSIKAARSGIVFYSGWRDGYGYTIVIQHEDGYSTFYAHCSKLFVNQGDWVNQGDRIALIGSTGRSTGPHLHYVIMRHGQLLNPFKYLW